MMAEKEVVDVLKKVKAEFENNEDIDYKKIILTALQRVVVECRVPGVTNSNLNDASLGTKKYKDAKAALIDKGTLKEIDFGRTKAIFLTKLIDNAAINMSEEENVK